MYDVQEDDVSPSSAFRIEKVVFASGTKELKQVHTPESPPSSAAAGAARAGSPETGVLTAQGGSIRLWIHSTLPSMHIYTCTCMPIIHHYH